jgi:hypothetical protein
MRRHSFIAFNKSELQDIIASCLPQKHNPRVDRQADRITPGRPMLATILTKMERRGIRVSHTQRRAEQGIQSAVGSLLMSRPSRGNVCRGPIVVFQTAFLTPTAYLCDLLLERVRLPLQFLRLCP